MSASLPHYSNDASPPEYFERVRSGAARRWDQLEADPELAGPWHQLFKQVQSPRHILSELLQNADDAGANQAAVKIQNDRFIFEHDGEDFIEAHFASLCRFGYSNKRALHTIGFRGIGFKSTFSLGGDRVELYTPTLAVAFRRARFTEPHWIPVASGTRAGTRIEVPIASTNLRAEVERNLAEWIKSPVSLLFFRSVRKLQIGDQVVHWESLGPGPIANSEWMALDGKAENQYLLVRSGEEPFPADALDEIRQERMVGAEDSGEFPPCRVEIVLGAKGRLYVVLPTGVETKLPFACNAPFIQDPARLKIKDPETSPTNRWLLRRAGQLAATAMTSWLRNSKLGMADRAAAYELLPDVDREATSLEGSCAALVEVAFDELIEGQAILLTDGGEIVEDNAAVSVPQALFDVWPPEQAIPLLDERTRQPLAKEVSARDRGKLIRWNLLEEITKVSLIERLRTRHLPRPSSWRRLLNLWAYIGPDVTGYACSAPETLKIVPVQGKEVLYSASEVARLGEKKLLQSEADWEFLSSHLLVLNQNWTRFLADERRERPEKVSDGQSQAEIAFDVLRRLNLQDTSDVSAVVERVAADFFDGKQATLAECVQLAQIAAKLGAEARSAFRYATADKHLHSIQDGVLLDEDGGLESLLPDAMHDTKLLHPAYLARFASCTREEWQRWVSSGRSGLLTLPALVQNRKSFFALKALTEEARARGLRGDLVLPYVTNNLYLEDWDFPADCWKHWESLSQSDPQIWAKVGDLVLRQGESYWSKAASARVTQAATTGTMRSLTQQPLLPSWLMKLRQRACLPDTREQLHVPGDLLRRTPETEYLLDVEPFVHGRLDREANRLALDLLGVRHTPDGPARLLERLRVLARAGRAPAYEVEKWYRRLDQLLDTASSGDLQSIKDMFRGEKVILAHDGTWVTSEAVFLTASEEDVPGAALIRQSVADLSLWHRVGVAEQPSADLAMQWLSTLDSGAGLAPDDARRVRTLLARYPRRIWEEVAHWMNLLGDWVPVESLDYALSLQSLFRWSHLHDHVKRRTADFQRLPAEVVTQEPFAVLPALAGLVEERFTHSPTRAGEHGAAIWLHAFGNQVRRIEMPDATERERIRAEATLIARAAWIEASALEVIPYLDGVPAGTSRLADVLWQSGCVYVSQLSKAKQAKRVPEEVGRNLSPDLRTALNYAFERPESDIRAYLEENFTLGPEQAALTIEATSTPAADTPDLEGAEQPEAKGGGDTAAPTLDLGAPTDDPVVPIPSAADGESNVPTVSPEPPAPDEPTTRSRPPPAPQRPSLIERFARVHGYKADGEGRFFAQDGSWLAKASSGRFPWERRARNGDVLRYLYPREHCLEREPLQIEADVWSLLDQKPDLYSFILLDPQGEPVELTGAKLKSLRDREQITIHPATYRLVYDGDQ